MENIILILALLFIKHFIMDFVLQRAYHFQNKGVYGHPGGLQHAALHGIGTFVCLIYFTPEAVALSFLDFAVHYHVDWFKTKFGPKDNTTSIFWVWFGADQLAHTLTYLWIVNAIVNA
jgi:hypothetical protein